MDSKVAVFWGCCIQSKQYAYEMSLRQTLPRLGVELVDLSETVCCGDPMRSVNDFAVTYLSSRILALAAKTGQTNLLVPCNRCHFMLSEARSLIAKDEKTRSKILGLLAEEGLAYEPNISTWHMIDFLHDKLGSSIIVQSIQKQLKGVKLANHPGCQILRYSDLGRVDDAENPKKLDHLITALGAESVDYCEKLDCCGAALLNSHRDSALSLAGTKLKSVQALSVDGLVVSCPDCSIMFDTLQKDAATTVGSRLEVPVVYYSQLLGLAMNIEPEKLGLHLNQSPMAGLLSKVSAQA